MVPFSSGKQYQWLSSWKNCLLLGMLSSVLLYIIYFGWDKAFGFSITFILLLIFRHCLAIFYFIFFPNRQVWLEIIRSPATIMAGQSFLFISCAVSSSLALSFLGKYQETKFHLWRPKHLAFSRKITKNISGILIKAKLSNTETVN